MGLVAVTYPGVWSLSQLFIGALSDRWGRKWLIAGGMWVQTIGIWVLLMGQGLAVWLVKAVLLGFGTALVYPTLRPPCLMWRDDGYAVGALLADVLGIPRAVG